MRLSSGHNKIGEIVRLPHEIVAAVFLLLVGTAKY